MPSDNRFFKETIASLGHFTSPSAADLKQQYALETLYTLNRNESAYGASPQVSEAIQQHAAELGNYPDMRDTALREALADVYGRDLTPDHFITGCSGSDVLYMITQAFLDPGDEIILTHPTFILYERLAALRHNIVRDVPLHPTTFEVDVDAILAAISDKTRILMLCNPNNPTGTIMTQAQMTRLMDGLPQGVLVVADEVYYQFVTDEQFPDTLAYILDGREVFITRSFSKAYGMAGMRMGYAIGTPGMVDYLSRYLRPFHQNHLQLVAGIAALRDQDHLQKNIDAGINGREYFYKAFDALDVRYWRSQTNFVLADVGRPAAPVAEALLKRGVAILSAPAGMTNCIRVSTGTPDANEAFVQALTDVLSTN